MAMIRTTNRDCRHLVQSRTSFVGSNITGVNYNSLFVVYSYGTHFPMWIYDTLTDQWLGNTDKYSRTTTRHQSQTRPLNRGTDILWMDTDQLKDVIRAGSYPQYTAQRLGVHHDE